MGVAGARTCPGCPHSGHTAGQFYRVYTSLLTDPLVHLLWKFTFREQRDSLTVPKCRHLLVTADDLEHARSGLLVPGQPRSVPVFPFGIRESRIVDCVTVKDLSSQKLDRKK